MAFVVNVLKTYLSLIKYAINATFLIHYQQMSAIGAVIRNLIGMK